MPRTKIATLTFRTDPALKEALHTAAQQEHRPIANRVEVLIRDHRGRNGIPSKQPRPKTGADKR